MSILTIHGKEVPTIFDLLGTKENDLSYSLGWVLAQCPPLINEVVLALTGQTINAEAIGDVEIRLQEHNKKDRGYSDVEIIVPGHCYLIIEMKRGWNLPSHTQLERYAQRRGLLDPSFPERRLVTFSECSSDYAQLNCPVENFTVAQLGHYNWSLLMMALGSARLRCSNKQKQLLDEFKTYIKKAISMRSIDTNWVWVVALTDDGMPGWSITFKDVVDTHKMYFHPVTKGDPPTYIGFKYKGRLHSIHFIEKYEIVNDASPIFNQPNGRPFGEPHYLYSLGPAIKSAHKVTYGKIWNPGRNWIMLDTLLTSATIEEALKATRAREKAFTS